MKWLQILLFNTNYFIQHYSFVYTQLNGSKYYYVSLTIQLNTSHLFPHNLNVKKFYLTQDKTLSDATTLGQSGPKSNCNEGILHISQSSCITGASPSDCLESYAGHSLGVRFYFSAEIQSVYSTAPSEWAS